MRTELGPLRPGLAPPHPEAFRPPARALRQAPAPLGYLLLPRDLTHQLLADQEQFSWELWYPLNSLHQVPNYLEQEQEKTEVGTRDTQVGWLCCVCICCISLWCLCFPPVLARVPTPAAPDHPVLFPSLPAPQLAHTLGPGHPYPDEHREQAPAARGQVDVGVQEVLMDKGVGEEGEPRQD